MSDRSFDAEAKVEDLADRREGGQLVQRVVKLVSPWAESQNVPAMAWAVASVPGWTSPAANLLKTDTVAETVVLASEIQSTEPCWLKPELPGRFKAIILNQV